MPFRKRARIRVWRNYPTCSNRKAAEVQGATTQPVQAAADPGPTYASSAFVAFVFGSWRSGQVPGVGNPVGRM